MTHATRYRLSTSRITAAALLAYVLLITSSTQPRERTNDEPSSRLLTLETSIRDERYVVEHGMPMLRWNLILTYKNSGTESILLYRKSSLIYRSMISRSIKAASRGQYEEETSSHFIDVDSMRAAGILDRLPEEADFVTLKPGESYSVGSGVWRASFGCFASRQSFGAG